MRPPEPKIRSLCMISARNLGDAVIHARFLRGLVERGMARRYIVWTFPGARFLFEGIPDCSIVTSDFPIGATIRSFMRGGYRGFLAALVLIFRRRPEQVLELVSDYRERALSALLLPRRRLYVHWETGHVFRRHNRIAPWRGRPVVDIPADQANLYAAYNRAFSALTGSEVPLFAGGHKPLSQGGVTVGLHPSASQPFKLWPAAHWQSLMRSLAERGCTLVLFGAPSDRPQLESLADGARVPAEIFTRSLPDFVRRLADVDLLVGLDSFSVHLANDQGVRTILLNGANDPRLFTPIGTNAVSRPGVCPFQPCYGRPACIGKDFQYACMTSITVAEVLSSVDRLLPTESGPREGTPLIGTASTPAE